MQRLQFGAVNGSGGYARNPTILIGSRSAMNRQLQLELERLIASFRSDIAAIAKRHIWSVLDDTQFQLSRSVRSALSAGALKAEDKQRRASLRPTSALKAPKRYKDQAPIDLMDARILDLLIDARGEPYTRDQLARSLRIPAWQVGDVLRQLVQEGLATKRGAGTRSTFAIALPSTD